MRRALVDDLLLVISELLTNVIRHANMPPTARMTMICHEPDDQGRVTVEVSDASPQMPRLREVDLADLVAEFTEVDVDEMDLAQLEVGGQGLRLLDALCVSWTCKQLSTGGKTVICILEMAA